MTGPAPESPNPSGGSSATERRTPRWPLIVALLNAAATWWLVVYGEEAMEAIRDLPWYVHVLTVGMVWLMGAIGFALGVTLVSALALVFLIATAFLALRHRPRPHWSLALALGVHAHVLALALVRWIVPFFTR